MRRAYSIVALLALVPLLGLLPADADEASGFHLESRVAADALAFVSVEDIGGMDARMRKTAIGRMMLDEEMQAFMAPLNKMGEQMLAEGAPGMPPIVMDLFEQMKGLRGQIALALVDVNMAEQSVEAAMSLDFGQHVGDFTTFLGRALEELEQGGPPIETLQKNGRIWWSLDTGPMPVFATTVDTAFVVATDEALLESLLGAAAVTGTLSDNADFVSVRGRVGGNDLAAFAYVNVPALLAKFSDQMGPQELHIANALGLDTLRAAAYGLSFKGDGFRDTMLLHAPGADHGLFTAFAMDPLTAPRTLDLVPANAFYWGEVNFPFGELMQRARTIVQAIDPDMVQQMDEGLATVDQIVGVNLEQELLAGMGDTYGVYAGFPPSGGLFPELAVIVQLKDGAGYESVLDRFSTSIAGILNEEGDVIASTRVLEYHGIRMHLFDLQAARGDDVIPFTPTWAILGDRLVMTLVPHTMKEIVLRAQGRISAPGLASKEDFQALMQVKPADSGAFVYLDLKSASALLYDTAVPLLQTVAKPNVMQDVQIPIDWAQLPPASRMMPYFRSMAEYVTMNENGLEIGYQGPIPMMPLFFTVGLTGALFGGMRASSASFEMPADEVMPYPDEFDDEMDLEVAKIQVEILADHVSTFQEMEARLPDTLKEMEEKGLIQGAGKDPWGGVYLYERRASGGYAIVSAGPDRTFNTRDDVRAERD